MSIDRLNRPQTPQMQTRPLDVSPKDRSTAFFLFGFLLACYLLTFTGLHRQQRRSRRCSPPPRALCAPVHSTATSCCGWATSRATLASAAIYYSRKGYGMVLLAMPLVWLAQAVGIDRLGACGAAAQPVGHRLDGCAALSHRAPPRLVAADVDRHGTALWPGDDGVAVYTGILQRSRSAAWGLFAAATHCWPMPSLGASCTCLAQGQPGASPISPARST